MKKNKKEFEEEFIDEMYRAYKEFETRLNHTPIDFDGPLNPEEEDNQKGAINEGKYNFL